MGNHGGQHVRHMDVLGIDRRAVALDLAVLAANRLSTDQGEALGIFQDGLSGRRDLARIGEQIAKGRAFA